MIRRGVILLLLVSACSTAWAGGGKGGDDARVALGNGVFEPPFLRVEEDTRVTFTNEDDRAHTVTSSWDDGATFHKVLRPGESFSWTFDDAGEFGGHCVPHVTGGEGHYEGMVMTVEVAEAAGSGDGGGRGDDGEVATSPPATGGEPGPRSDRSLLIVGIGAILFLAGLYVVVQRWTASRSPPTRLR